MSVYVLTFEYEVGGVCEALFKNMVMVRLDFPPQRLGRQIYTIPLRATFEFGSKPFTVQNRRELSY